MGNINAILYSFIFVPVFLMMISSYVGNKAKGKSSRSFSVVLAFDCIMLFLQTVAEHLLYRMNTNQYEPYMKYVQKGFKAGGDVAFILVLLFFVRYVIDYIGEKQQVSYKAFYICSVICIPTIIMWALTSFNGIIYSKEGEVSRKGPYFHIGMLGLYAMYLAIILLIMYYRQAFRPEVLLSFLGFAFIPLSGTLFRRYTKASLLPVFLTYAIMMVQGFVQRSRYIQMQYQAEELERMKLDATVSQIRPHFIYNTLNAIYALCDISSDKAKEAIATFAEYLRGAFRLRENRDLIPFEQELNHIKNYLTIEKLRFEEALDVSYDIRFTDFYVPPLSVQPIVENSVRHGIGKKVEGGSISISAYSEGDSIIVRIEDTGKGFDADAVKEGRYEDGEKHIGLESSKYRLNRLCDASLSIESTIGKGTRITITIPK